MTGTTMWTMTASVSGAQLGGSEEQSATGSGEAESEPLDSSRARGGTPGLLWGQPPSIQATSGLPLPKHVSRG